MKLVRAQVQNYRSVIDSGVFEIESLKSIFVGPNEAGKTVLLRAIQQLNKPKDIEGFDPLRDYPRSKYNDITTGKVKPENVTVVTGFFALDEADKALIPSEFHGCEYNKYKNLDDQLRHSLVGGPAKLLVRDIKKDMVRMCSHMDSVFAKAETDDADTKPSESYRLLSADWPKYNQIASEVYSKLKKWLDDNYEYVDEDNAKEEERHTQILDLIQLNNKHDEALKILDKRTPVFILFNNYFKVKPSIHLEHLAQRIEQNIMDDDEYYDYGNLCLLKLLGFTARELADLGNTPTPNMNDKEALKAYRDKLDTRSYQLNAASVRLTQEIRSVWMPNPDRPEADKLKLTADGQYLKVVVEDDLGVDIELDQRSEGFQWLVSFFVVFFSEAMDKHENAILLLDEPGMSLHALKQRDFRETISRLAIDNQTIFTTHSPFLVGPDELDYTRIVELKSREIGTKVHTIFSSDDPAGMLPLQEALGYDLASSLFSQQRNLIMEGITDYWYVEATCRLLDDADVAKINDKIALVFANSAGKVVYYATILHAHHLKVAALLDSDSAGDQAAQQDNLVHTLGNKKILRTKDFCDIEKSEIEDLLRETLISVVNDEFECDVSSVAKSQPERPIVDIFSKEVDDFSKYKLAKAYVRWTRDHSISDLNEKEITQWKALVTHINKVLK